MTTLPLILACSGPGAMATIRQSVLSGEVCAGLGGVATLGIAVDCVRTRRFRLTLPVAVLLLTVQPAWTMSAVRGDCGCGMREAAYLLTALFIGLLIWQYLTSRRPASHAPQRDDEGSK